MISNMTFFVIFFYRTWNKECGSTFIRAVRDKACFNRIFDLLGYIWSSNIYLFEKIKKKLKWMEQCHNDVHQNSILRLEYAYLLFNNFIMNRIISELIKIRQISTSFSVTKRSCDDTLTVSKKNPRSSFGEIHEQILSSFWL